MVEDAAKIGPQFRTIIEPPHPERRQSAHESLLDCLVRRVRVEEVKRQASGEPGQGQNPD